MQRYPYLKTIFGIFRSQGRAASDYWMLISSRLFPDGPNLIEKILFYTFSVEWEDLLKIDELNAGNSTKKFLDEINMLLDTYAPLKRVEK